MTRWRTVHARARRKRARRGNLHPDVIHDGWPGWGRQLPRGWDFGPPNDHLIDALAYAMVSEPWQRARGPRYTPVPAFKPLGESLIMKMRKAQERMEEQHWPEKLITVVDTHPLPIRWQENRALIDKGLGEPDEHVIDSR